MNFDQLRKAIEDGKTEAELQGIEYKQSWEQEAGKEISAIANYEPITTGWLVIGIKDNGQSAERDAAWLRTTEQNVSSHIRQYLEPSWAAKSIFGKEINGHYYLFIEITSPQDVVKWNGKAYRRVGTQCHEMRADEVMSLSLRLPGTDFSKLPYRGDYNSALVVEFGKKVVQQTDEFQIDPKTTSPDEMLRKLKIYETNVTAILFGNIAVRIANFDAHGDILDQRRREGLYTILSDSFIEELQSLSRKKGTQVKENTTSATEETPYPPKALREILANAVAHALYQKSNGDIVVEIHPNRITVRNNSTLEAKAFVDKWFSRINKPTNKHLMNTLQIPRITDEQGTGKIRIYRLMMEAGKSEPIIDFEPFTDYGRWSITLFNEESNRGIKAVSEELRTNFPDPDQWRMATALLLWRDRKWSEIERYLDEYYKYVANQVINSKDTPVIRTDDQLFTKRWVLVRLTGQVTKQFSEAEKTQIYQFLSKWAFSHGQDGNITSEDARRIIGMSNTPNESSQLARLFSDWQQEGKMKMTKRGHWKFLNNPK